VQGNEGQAATAAAGNLIPNFAARNVYVSYFVLLCQMPILGGGLWLEDRNGLIPSTGVHQYYHLAPVRQARYDGYRRIGPWLDSQGDSP